MATWIKSVPLSDREQDSIRMHPHHTERVLAQSAALRQAGTVAGQHHERLNGSGYHRGLRARDLPPLSRILAAAEAYQTKIEARPHRAALSPERAADEVKRQVRVGALDGEAVAAVLNAAGHRVALIRRQMTADLTSREIDVLRLVGRGLSAKQIARELGISPKTADNHTQNIYAKIGVSTRPAAALFAIEHGLLTVGEQK